jgi:putative FmdB family regulatory protein
LPLYEYQCPQCGRFEQIQKFSDPVLTTCPTCASPVEKLLSPPAIQFKGSGWYVTDYAGKSSDKDARASDKKEGGEGAKKDSHGAKDTKGETAKAESSPSSTGGKGTSSK